MSDGQPPIGEQEPIPHEETLGIVLSHPNRNSPEIIQLMRLEDCHDLPPNVTLFRVPSSPEE